MNCVEVRTGESARSHLKCESKCQIDWHLQLGVKGMKWKKQAVLSHTEAITLG